MYISTLTSLNYVVYWSLDIDFHLWHGPLTLHGDLPAISKRSPVRPQVIVSTFSRPVWHPYLKSSGNKYPILYDILEEEGLFYIYRP
jgi:hypothetical protein